MHQNLADDESNLPLSAKIEAWIQDKGMFPPNLKGIGSTSIIKGAHESPNPKPYVYIGFPIGSIWGPQLREWRGATNDKRTRDESKGFGSYKLGIIPHVVSNRICSFQFGSPSNNMILKIKKYQ